MTSVAAKTGDASTPTANVAARKCPAAWFKVRTALLPSFSAAFDSGAIRRTLDTVNEENPATGEAMKQATSSAEIDGMVACPTKLMFSSDVPAAGFLLAPTGYTKICSNIYSNVCSVQVRVIIFSYQDISGLRKPP